jgi:hypothetical protein
MLFDFAQGIDLGPRPMHGLSMLKDFDVSGFNFVGVSLNGVPITREMLQSAGIRGAENALYTMEDIERYPDKKRRDLLNGRLERAFLLQDRVIKEGVVNLVCRLFCCCRSRPKSSRAVMGPLGGQHRQGQNRRLAK